MSVNSVQESHCYRWCLNGLSLLLFVSICGFVQCWVYCSVEQATLSPLWVEEGEKMGEFWSATAPIKVFVFEFFVKVNIKGETSAGIWICSLLNIFISILLMTATMTILVVMVVVAAYCFQSKNDFVVVLFQPEKKEARKIFSTLIGSTNFRFELIF